MKREKTCATYWWRRSFGTQFRQAGVSVSRIMILAACAFLAACTFNTKGVPPKIQRGEAQMTSQGNRLGSVHSVFVKSSPFVTIAGSLSHIPGAQDMAHPGKTVRMASQINAPTLYFSMYEGACAISDDLSREYRRLLDSLFIGVDQGRDWRKLELDIHLLPQGAGIERKVYSVKPGRRAKFELYFLCSKADPVGNSFFAFLKSTHELSHAMFTLVGLDGTWTPGGYQEEVLAEGGPACVYRYLNTEGDPQHLEAVLDEASYFGLAWETFTEPEKERQLWCQHWLEALGPKP